jgi:hypothetical protein
LLIDFCLIFVPFGHCDEPEILSYENPSVGPKGADVRHTQSLMQTEVYSVPKAQRKTIETLFGEDKQIHSMIRLR